MTFAQQINKNSRILHDTVFGQEIFSRFFGEAHTALAPVSYAYGESF